MRTVAASDLMLSERGRGNLGCLFGLLVVVGLGFFGYKFGPHYVSHFQLKDAMTEIAVYQAAGIGGQPAEGTKGIQQQVLRKAQELGIPLQRENIKVRNEGEKIFITVKYSVPVELPGTVYDLNFAFTAHN